MTNPLDNIVKEVRASRVLPKNFRDADSQTQRKVEVEARWHETTPEAYYRNARAAADAADALADSTDEVLAQIQAVR